MQKSKLKVKSQNVVIPAKAGIQGFTDNASGNTLDPRFHGDDKDNFAF